jgi:glycosyltransferase involved in cell wall biosynthesis
MELNVLSVSSRYLLVIPLPFSLTNDNLYAVGDQWGYDLEAMVTTFPNLHIFAPFDPVYGSDKFPYIFPKESTITFHPLPYFISTYELFKKIPEILLILIRNIKEDDIVQSAGGVQQVLGAFALVLCAVVRHHKRILVLDGDEVEDLAVRAQLAQRRTRKLFLASRKCLVSSVLQLLIAFTPLTFVVGDRLYARYAHIGNVKKIYASWIRKNRIISPVNLRRKVQGTLKRLNLRIVFAAGLFPKKRPDIAIEVAAIVHKKGIPFKLDIYGAGPMQKELLDSIKFYNLSGIVALKGTVDYSNFHRVLARYDILLLPNLSGEQPRVLFDAMANGVLVIASDIVSLSGIIKNNENGILCDPGSPDTFASAIERLYINTGDLEPLLCNGMLTARKNTIDSMHEERRSIIQETFSDRK